MNFGSVLAGVAICAALLLVPRTQGASGPDDLYLGAYRLIQEGDQLVQSGQAQTARQRYEDAAANLKRIQAAYPNYSRNAVEFRLEYLEERLKSLPAARTDTPPAQRAPARPSVEPNDVRALQGQIARFEAENSTLQAKLQEALSAKPAAIDPSELIKAEDRIKQLEKERELLRVNLQHAQARQPQAVDQAMLDQARSELEATKKRLVDAVANVATLAREKQDLEQELSGTANLRNTLREAETKAAQLERERAEVETRLAAASRPQSENARVKDLEKERDSLMKKLNDANRELYDVKARGQAAQFQNLTNQLSNLRARLEVFEARKVPFTAEELALMDKTVPKLTAAADPRNARRNPRELPAGASLLVLEAERAFATRRYEEAEAKYRQVLEMDPDNTISLANVAAIQLEQQKLPDAEANLTRAIRLAPDDPYTLALMGMLRFQQGNFEQALESLTRSAQLDPNNAETQNYLGITLSQQGHREAAETALRKAISLNPNYASAHHNLAVVYATQRPPFLELARYHYNKALAFGQPQNRDLEKQIGK